MDSDWNRECLSADILPTRSLARRRRRPAALTVEDSLKLV